jgi:hypothetical protein
MIHLANPKKYKKIKIEETFQIQHKKQRANRGPLALVTQIK